MRFDNAYLTASSCSPSRASIITARYPHNNGAAAELHRRLPDHLALFPELLRRAMDRWQKETGDSLPTDATPEWVEFMGDRLLGLKDYGKYGTPPGGDLGAERINAPGAAVTPDSQARPSMSNGSKASVEGRACESVLADHWPVFSRTR